MLSIVLEDNKTYQNCSKSLFIKKLEGVFEEFIQSGNTYLKKHEGFCNAPSCNFKSKGYCFIGNKTAHYFEIIIDIKDGIVHDMYECAFLKPAIKI